eukprot:TRINITY_DN33725_c0_g1_i1.p1 TRINITY_DN33725_c0_g1~~TRINITY_DN33725_c0_g1_i1.p1  ORF type:complete len:364 (-),score=88.22 TRINITY_DN33725_c0_g1_i1:35-1126(-)
MGWGCALSAIVSGLLLLLTPHGVSAKGLCLTDADCSFNGDCKMGDWEGDGADKLDADFTDEVQNIIQKGPAFVAFAETGSHVGDVDDDPDWDEREDDAIVEYLRKKRCHCDVGWGGAHCEKVYRNFHLMPPPHVGIPHPLGEASGEPLRRVPYSLKFRLKTAKAPHEPLVKREIEVNPKLCTSADHGPGDCLFLEFGAEAPTIPLNGYVVVRVRETEGFGKKEYLRLSGFYEIDSHQTVPRAMDPYLAGNDGLKVSMGISQSENMHWTLQTVVVWLEQNMYEDYIEARGERGKLEQKALSLRPAVPQEVHPYKMSVKKTSDTKEKINPCTPESPNVDTGEDDTDENTARARSAASSSEEGLSV